MRSKLSSRNAARRAKERHSLLTPVVHVLDLLRRFVRLLRLLELTLQRLQTRCCDEIGVR